mgnify:CR=1 FL=1
MKFKVGDKVIAIKNEFGCFSVGAIGYIIAEDGEDEQEYLVQWVDGDFTGSEADIDFPEDTWYATSEQIKLFNEEV